MSELDQRSTSSEWYAGGFARMFWAIPFLAFRVGPTITIGKELFVIDLPPDPLGYLLVVAGANRLLGLHVRARSVRNLALVLSYLSILTVIQYWVVGDQVGTVTHFSTPLWPLSAAVDFLGLVMVWRICGIVADLARRAGVGRTERAARNRRMLYATLTILAWGGGAYVLLKSPEQLMPAVGVYLFFGLILVCLLMGLMSQARRVCLSSPVIEQMEVEAGTAPNTIRRPGWVARLIAVGAVLAAIGFVGGLQWYYNDWKDARDHWRRQPDEAKFGKVAGDFLAHLEADRPDAAYELTTPRFRNQTSREDFVGLVRRYPAFSPEVHPLGSGSGGGSQHHHRHFTVVDQEGRHLQVSLFVRRGEDSIVRRRPPPPGVDEFNVEEIDSIESRRSRADALTRRAEKKKSAGDYEEAERLCHRALELYATEPPPASGGGSLFPGRGGLFAGPAFETNHPMARFLPLLTKATTHDELGDVLVCVRRYREAGEQYRQACAIHEELAPTAEDPNLERNGMSFMHRYAAALARDGRCYALFRNGRRGEADAERKKADATWQLLAPQYSKNVGNWRDALQEDPERPYSHNLLAWFLVACPNSQLHQPAEAIALARKAAELADNVKPPIEPSSGKIPVRWGGFPAYNGLVPPPDVQITLGAALYRTGDYQGAAETLTKALVLPDDGRLFFLLAMTHWRLDHQVEARQWYEKAIRWMEPARQQNAVMCRLRSEVGLLLQIGAVPTEASEEEKKPVDAETKTEPREGESSEG